MENELKIEGGHVQWTFQIADNEIGKESNPFKIGIWNWTLRLETSLMWVEGSYKVRLFPAESEEPPLAGFYVAAENTSLRVKCSTRHKGLLLPLKGFELDTESLFRKNGDVHIIDVEFWELKIPSPSGDAIFIWPIDERSRETTRMSTPKSFSRMLNESILTDTTINMADGKHLQAHRAVLSANSPVFHKMFAHDFKEKQSSTIDIVDMSFESCKALLHYMYGSINKDDFSNHRLALLAAANKYDIPELKDRCEESLLNDIDNKNVRERLEKACLYDLSKLKKKCIRHLFDSEKIDNLGEDFLRSADYVLVNEIFQEALEQIRKAKRKKLSYLNIWQFRLNLFFSSFFGLES